MESILNPGLPHISEKIIKCLDIESIFNCRSLNCELKKTLNDDLFEVTKKSFLKKIKCIKLTEDNVMKESHFVEKWLSLFKVLDQGMLWDHGVKENVFLCLIRIMILMKKSFGSLSKLGKYKRFLEKSDMEPVMITLDLAARTGNLSLIEIIIQPIISSQLNMLDKHIIIFKLMQLSLSNQNVLSHLKEDLCIDFKEYSIHQAIALENVNMMRTLFQVYIEDYQTSERNSDGMINFLNRIPSRHFLEFHSGLTPIYIAAKNGNLDMIKLYLEHINYIDNINLKIDGKTPIEWAARYGHGLIVNMLLPLTTDLEYQTTARISSQKLQEYIKMKIEKFVRMTDTNEVVARSYLSNKSWNLSTAINDYSQSPLKDHLKGQSLSLELESMIKQFKEDSNVNHDVAQCYILQNCFSTNCDTSTQNRNVIYAIENFNKYRSNLWQCNYQEVSCLNPSYAGITYPDPEIQLKIKEFVENIETDRTVAIKYLSKQNWDIEAALELLG